MKSEKQKKANKLINEKNLISKKNLTIEEAKIRKKYKINLFICLIYAVLIQIYFISLNAINTSMQNFDMYIKISYIVFILIAVLMFEVAYKKGKKNLAVNGIEFILLAMHLLLVGRKVVKFNILSTSYIWPIYYCLKALLIHTNENKRKLKEILDITEIVKEEKPTKKVAKKRKK